MKCENTLFFQMRKTDFVFLHFGIGQGALQRPEETYLCLEPCVVLSAYLRLHSWERTARPASDFPSRRHSSQRPAKPGLGSCVSAVPGLCLSTVVALPELWMSSVYGSPF